MSNPFADAAPDYEVPLPPEPLPDDVFPFPKRSRGTGNVAPGGFPGGFTGAWLDQQHFPALQWIVPGLIPEGQTLLVGPPKAGKSWLVNGIGLACAVGGLVMGQRVEQRPVLYLALEDGQRRLQYRSRQLLAEDALPAAITYVIRVEQNWMQDAAVWLNHHADRRPLIIVDTLGKVKPPARAGGSAYEHDYAVMSALKVLVDDVPGSGQILVHHDRKASSDDFLDNVSGTHGLAGAADTTVVLSRPRTEAGAVLSVTGREVAEAEYGVSFDNGVWTLSGDSLAEAQQAASQQRATANLGDRSTDILAYVYQHPEGVHPKDVAGQFQMAPNDAAQYLRRLFDGGRIDRPFRGTYTPVVSVVSVVTGEESPPDTTVTTDTTPIQVGAHSDSGNVPGTSGTDDGQAFLRSSPPMSGTEERGSQHYLAECGHPPFRTAKCPLCIAAEIGGEVA